MLIWSLDSSGDAAELWAFKCTAPPTKGPPDWRPRHPALWEFDAQTYLRRIPDKTSPYCTLVGRDAAGIAAASVWLERDGGERIDLLAIGVAVDRRGRGLGDAVMDETLSQITSRAVDRGLREVLLVGYVDRRNQRSHALVARFNFVYSGEGEPGVLEVQKTLPIAGVVDEDDAATG